MKNYLLKVFLGFGQLDKIKQIKTLSEIKLNHFHC
jgi:hypothetical protein